MAEQHGIRTLAVHGGGKRPGPEGSLVYPIYQGTVFTVEPGATYDDIRYIRLSTTPSQQDLHARLASLEGAEASLATASGMAALSAILMGHLRRGDHVLAGECLYGGTHDFLTKRFDGLGLSFTFVDPGQPADWAAAVRPETRMFLVESITNPLMRVGRLREVAAFARERGLLSVIDNTFASPVNFRPLAAGFDLVFHSATKYLNGHSDLVAGCIMGREDLVTRARHALNHYGGSLDPHTCFLLGRGLKTLALRVAAQNENGLALATALSGHAGVASVSYPGLPRHPDHDHARQLLSGFGGMVSFRPVGGLPAAEALLRRLRIPFVAPSLGGVETLVTRPAQTSHAGMDPAERERLGIGEDLVRVSCGIEDPRDLVGDFLSALEGA